MVEDATKPEAAAGGERGFAFASFQLYPGRRLLLEGDRQIRLGSRALDILAFLVGHAGRVVAKEELIAQVWPRVFVEESNLKIQISALRRALGDGQAGSRYIVTVPGRGYEFVALVRRAEGLREARPPTIATAGPHNLPVALTRMIGRAAAVAGLTARLSRERLLTIVGPGGIGKTTLALAVAEAMIAAYPDGVWLVDLAPLDDPRLVPSAIASAVGLEVRSANPLPEIIAGLQQRQMLLVLDNCEHVIAAAAEVLEAILKGTTAVNVLATSREALRVEGERLFHLAPLADPPRSPRLSAAEALQFPAVLLFVERASAIVEDFVLSDADAPLVAEICRRLDGLPLAIELAAAHIGTFGIVGLSRLVNNRLRLPRARRRATSPRHQTMSAMLDWSYGSLSAGEQRFLRCLAIFAGSFTVAAAAYVAIDGAQPQAGAIDGLADLISKSMVIADISGVEPHFRLLETTRAYALEKLAESHEFEQTARRHAEYYQGLFERGEVERETRAASEWMADCRIRIDNLRAALEWAFSSTGDLSLGVTLTVVAVPLWIQLSLVEECRERVERALATLERTSSRSPRHEAQLYAALGLSLLHVKGAVHEAALAWTKALEIAERLDDTEYKLRATWGLWVYRAGCGDYRTALALALRFCRIAANQADRSDLLIGDRMVGVSLHFLGDQSNARRHIERMLSRYIAPVHYSPIVRFQYDQRIAARVTLARILWLQGFPDQAMRTAESAVEDALATDHELSQCFALAAAACAVALFTGDLAATERFVAMLLDRSARLSLAGWNIWGRCFHGALLIKRGEIVTGLPLLRTALDELLETRFTPHLPEFLGALADGLAGAGQVAQALAAVDKALMQSENTEVAWCIAELLRIKGMLVLLQDAPGAGTAAEGLFRQALDWAHRQGALSWELRAATSLARLLRDRGRSADAVAVLKPVCDRFTEGFDTADPLAARGLLDELNDVGRH